MRENTKTLSKPKVTTTKKTIQESTLTKPVLTRNTMMSPTTTEHIIMRSMEKNTLSTRKRASTPKVTVLKAVTTSTKRKNMKKELNSSKKMVIRQKKRNMEVTTKKGNTHRVGTSKKQNSKQGTMPTTRVMRATTRQEVMPTAIRVTNGQRATTVTDATTTPISMALECNLARNGATVMPRQQRSRMLLQLIAELTNSMLARNITDELTGGEEQR